jgi:hypothetical protein
MKFNAEIIIGLIVLLLIAACTQQSVTCPDGSSAANVAACPAPPQKPAETKPPAETPPQTNVVDKVEQAVNLDPAIKTLIDMPATKVQSMSFTHAPMETTSAGIVTNVRNRYLVRGSKMKVEVKKPISHDDTTYIDTVYLDREAKSIKAFCNDAALCSVTGEQRPAAYEDYAITLPLDWLASIPGDATLQSSTTFDRRKVTIIRYARDEKFYEMYLDQFTGVPLRVAIFSDSDRLKLIGGVEYRDFGLNNVREADVTP